MRENKMEPLGDPDGAVSEAEGTGCRGAGEELGAPTAGRAPAEMRTHFCAAEGGDSGTAMLTGAQAGAPGVRPEVVPGSRQSQ